MAEAPPAIRVTLLPVAAVGHLASGLEAQDAVRAVSVPVYAQSPASHALGTHRRALGLTASAAAVRVGVSFLDYLMLEQGRYTLANDQEWLEAARRLERG